MYIYKHDHIHMNICMCIFCGFGREPYTYVVNLNMYV